ncbi:hypothetical protein P7C70_g2874, partial [Phenoliferia sp. Uapishka_3]
MSAPPVANLGPGVSTNFRVYHYPKPRNYLGIQQYHFGLIGPDSHVDGLCTFNVASCLAFVVHCSDTSRSSLTHTPLFVENWDSFRDQLDFVTAGSPGKAVDIVIFKGNHYTPENIVRFEHESSVARFKASLQTIARPASTSLTFTEVEKMLPHGALLLEKGTGVLSVPVIHLSVPGSHGAVLHLTFQQANSGPTSIFNRRFAITGLECTYTQVILFERFQIYLQYDGKQDQFTARLGDGAREILRAKRRGASPPAIEMLARSLSRQIFGFPNFSMFLMILDMAVSAGQWCEVCGKDGVPCSKCQGAFYCGKLHQLSDWEIHKAW